MPTEREPIAILTADLHLGVRGRWANRPGLAGDAEYSFDQICDRAIKSNIPRIIAAGDLLDHAKPDAATVQFLHEKMDLLDKHDIEFLFIQGNHEKSNPAWFDTHKIPFHMDRDLVQLKGPGGRYVVDLYGIDAIRNPEELSVAVKEAPECDILVVHQMWQELCATGAQISDGTLTEVTCAPRVLTGDVHVHREFAVTNQKGDELQVWSPGSTSMRAINEDPKKYYFVLYSDLTVTSRQLRTRRFWDAPAINTLDELESVRKRVERRLYRMQETGVGLPEQLRKPMIRFTAVQEMVESHKAFFLLRKEVGDQAHLFFRNLAPETEEVVVDAEKRRELRARGLSGCLELVVDPETELYRDTRRLLDADSPEEAIQAIRGRFVTQES